VISLPTRPFPALATARQKEGAPQKEEGLTRARGYPRQPLPLGHRPEQS
jgi:hypothetical protein